MMTLTCQAHAKPQVDCEGCEDQFCRTCREELTRNNSPVGADECYKCADTCEECNDDGVSDKAMHVRQLRLQVIGRAVTHLENTDRDVLLGQLAKTRLHEKFQRSPEALTERLLGANPCHTARFFSAYKGAQGVLVAAGISPY